MRVLAIETSCDETGIAIYDSQKGIIANALYSQITIHAEYGGIVPELASRDHIRKITPLLRQALTEATCRLAEIDGIAYTAGPGLVGALLVGASFGRALGWALNVPTIAVHHMEGHLLAPLLEKPAPQFPFIALLVSGGHTLLIHVSDIGQYEILGESIDDAIGEAFDKTAKLLGIPYPGGAELERLARKGNPKRFHFPRPMTDRPGLDFSFSGLKTYAMNVLKKEDVSEETRSDVARAFQDAVIDTISIKCRRAFKETGLSRLVVSGGVSANQFLRAHLHKVCKQLEALVYYPRLEYCTDNGAMIAFAGYQRLKQGLHDDLSIKVQARWPMETLKAII